MPTRLVRNSDVVISLAVRSSQDGHSVPVGLSALLYVARWDMTRAYVVPRYA